MRTVNQVALTNGSTAIAVTRTDEIELQGSTIGLNRLPYYCGYKIKSGQRGHLQAILCHPSYNRC
jgi:hypothetical protein